ncbi:MAG TPA: phospholipid scramblase-related protein [Bdellovibrionales bacterium]|jgi:uncharacterized protein YxjI|nr:phospholipid scramblase-related protein [Bdellovibrionales bacterium]
MSESNNLPALSQHTQLFVRQVHELAELFGFETRNKYEISDDKRSTVAYAAEQQKGIFGFLFRQFLGHWRKYEVMFFTPSREPFFKAHHPFRFIFHRFEVMDNYGHLLGVIQQRFSILTKRFDVQTAQGMTLMEVSSPIWRIWTFPFVGYGRERAVVSKKWGGVLTEIFTDKDTFMIEFKDQTLSENERKLVLAASVFIDMKYFEIKAD